MSPKRHLLAVFRKNNNFRTVLLIHHQGYKFSIQYHCLIYCVMFCYAINLLQMSSEMECDLHEPQHKRKCMEHTSECNLCD